MQSIQEIFNRIQETKKKQKDIKTTYKDALAGVAEYQEITDKLKQLREKKKQIEAQVQQDFSSEFTKLDDYKIDIESDMTLLSDAVLTKVMKGETIEIEDEYNNKYEPIFKVNFKKT
jgi:predicted nuclease with TOPRIM domain